MELSKVGSKTTYHRSIKELSHWKYLLYTPSHNPFQGSRIKMHNFGTTDGQLLYQSHTNIETSSGQELVSKTKHKQTVRNKTNNNNKQQNLKNSNSKNFKTKDKQNSTVPYKDNLKTSTDKDYNEPL